MLVLTRKRQEQICIGDNIVLTILRVKGNTVRVGIEAPRDVRVVRGELPPKDVNAVSQTVAVTDAPSFESANEEGTPAESSTVTEEKLAESDVLGQLVRKRRASLQIVANAI